MASNIDTSLSRYQHTPFEDETSIRLLLLKTGNFDDDINIELTVVSLSDPPPYRALSYVWGPPPHVAPILCYGKDLLVSESCVAALRRLRSTTIEEVLWIDAICINQISMKEREQQMKLMGDVYSNASTTCIWLGESTWASEYIMTFLENFNRILEQSRNLSPSHRDVMLKLKIEKLEEVEKQLREHDPATILPIQSLCKRSWFERVWTIQEYTLSSKAIVICGGQALPILELHEGVLSITKRREAKDPAIEKPYSHSFLAHCYYYRRIWATIHFKKRPFTFTRLLVEGQKMKASVPQDVVFGLYGMLQKLQIQVPPPDYSKSVETVFTEATKAAILHDESLAALLHCSISITVDSSPSWPSWVPDWSTYPGFQPLRPFTSIVEMFKASGNSKASFNFSDEQEQRHTSFGLLSVEGSVIDVLKYCASEVFHQTSTPDQKPEMETLSAVDVRRLEHMAMYKTIEAWTTKASKLSPYPTGESLLGAFSRTLILDEYRRPAKQSSYPDLDVSQGFTHWLHSFRIASSCSDEDSAEGEEFSSKAFKHAFFAEIGQSGTEISETNAMDYVQQSLDRNANALAFDDLAYRYSENSCFFTTMHGYMGAGLPGVKPGDEVILVGGVSRPLIARKMGDRYRLLGPAYIHGVMDGEKWPEDERELVSIVFE